MTSVPVLADGDLSPPTLNDPLVAQFQEPPNSARPLVWWHWINGNITADGITKDLAWMKRAGIGGVQSFDANLKSPQIVDKRLVYMTPEWKMAFRTATQVARQYDLELAIASSPGWSETGGPWVPPQDGMKKLVWSRAQVKGGQHVRVHLASPPDVTGPYQDITTDSGTNSNINDKGPELPAPFYRDVAVLAFPVSPAHRSLVPKAVTGEGRAVEMPALLDDDLKTSLEVAKAKKSPTSLEMTYSVPQTFRTLTLFVQDGAGKFVGANLSAKLEARNTLGEWTLVRDIPLSRVPTTSSFSPVTARQFRVVFNEVNNLPKMAPPPPGVDLFSLASGFAPPGQNTTIRIADLHLRTDARIDRAEAKAGYDIVPDYFALGHESNDNASVPLTSVLDITDRMRPDGTLDWQAPKGNWQVLRLGYSLIGTMNHPAPREATGLEVDKYDAAAVRRYMDHYIGMYRDTVGPDMVGTGGLRAILNDSIEVGAANWTPHMVDQFKRLRGYDPTPWLPTLTGTIIGSRDESDRFLFDFRRTLADLLASEHYGTVAKVAHENGLKVYGEALEDHRPQLGDDLAMRSHTDVPMAAMWHFPISTSPKPTYLADIKGAASVAHIYGKPVVAAESLTSALAPWAYGPRELKHVVDLEFATGVNRPVIHTSVHVPIDDRKPGIRLSIFGQDFNRNEAWAELARPWADYIARTSLILQQGRNVADIAYFYGEEGPVTGVFGNGLPEIPKTNAYDFVNADALLTQFSNDGNELVTTGGARYRVLVLGGASHKMSLRVLRQVAALVEGGAILIGKRPEGDPGVVSNLAEYDSICERLWTRARVATVGKGKVIASTNLQAALLEAGVTPDFAYVSKEDDSNLPFAHRRLADGDIYFISNQKNRNETLTARFRSTGRAPEIWHAESGTREPVSYEIDGHETIVPMTLGPADSRIVIFRNPAKVTAAVFEPFTPRQLAKLDGPWKVEFEAGRGAPSNIELARLAPLNESENDAIKYFSGIATYTREFQVPRSWKPGTPLKLDLGEAYEIAEVSVNGKLAGYAWHAPYIVDISTVAKRGKNRVQVRVGNLWVNRFIGDAQPNATKITWTASPMYRANATLRPSGLVGPVSLIEAK